jgi:hypothetical protein
MDRRDVALVAGSTTIRVLDVSVAGVLMQSARPVKVGARGTLRLTIGGESFASDVVVAWVSDPPARVDGYRIGARLVGVSPEHLQMIERFTS